MYEIKSRRLRLLILTCFTFQVLFSKKSRFRWKKQPFRKNVIVEKELYCIDIDDIGNLEDSSRLVFTDEECGNLTVVNDGGELTRNINQKKKSDVLQKSIDVHSVINVVGESISSVAMWNICCESLR